MAKQTAIAAARRKAQVKNPAVADPLAQANGSDSSTTTTIPKENLPDIFSPKKTDGALVPGTGKLNLTANSLECPKEDYNYTDWLSDLGALGVMGYGWQFWIGDMCRHAINNFGVGYDEVITAASQVTGRDYATIKNYESICSSVPPERRVLDRNISFTHHEAVRALAPKEQTKYLKLAQKNAWGREEMKARIKADKEAEKMRKEAELLAKHGPPQEGDNAGVTETGARVGDPGADDNIPVGAVLDKDGKVVWKPGDPEPVTPDYMSQPLAIDFEPPIREKAENLKIYFNLKGHGAVNDLEVAEFCISKFYDANKVKIEEAVTRAAAAKE